MNDRALIIEARYYNHINDMLLQGATEELQKRGIPYDVVTVPGALEIPAALGFS
jgi:6,7-dimethyl-8-ribityllumazine synthase